MVNSFGNTNQYVEFVVERGREGKKGQQKSKLHVAVISNVDYMNSKRLTIHQPAANGRRASGFVGTNRFGSRRSLCFV